MVKAKCDSVFLCQWHFWNEDFVTACTIVAVGIRMLSWSNETVLSLLNQNVSLQMPRDAWWRKNSRLERIWVQLWPFHATSTPSPLPWGYCQHPNVRLCIPCNAVMSTLYFLRAITLGRCSHLVKLATSNILFCALDRFHLIWSAHICNFDQHSKLNLVSRSGESDDTQDLSYSYCINAKKQCLFFDIYDYEEQNQTRFEIKLGTFFNFNPIE